MKRPSLFVAACLAAGILCGPPVGSRLSHAFPVSLLAALVTLLAAFSLFLARRESIAWSLALVAWCLLGVAAAVAEPLAVPVRHVTRQIASNRLPLSGPLRWRGRLRADPLRLPWGVRYVVDLEQVETAGHWQDAAGGLRVNYYASEHAADEHQRNERAREDFASLAALRAGDRVELLLRATPPRNFGDPGAFDYRAFLARQNIDLLGSLRDAELLTRLAGPPPTIAQRIARVRGRLLAEIDDLVGNDPARAAVARAMLLGDRSFLDSDQIDFFQQTGAYHVLVVAGLHVGFLVAALLWFFGKLRLPLGLSTFLVLAGLAGYVGIVEDRAPIFRAALMATAFLLGRLLYRRVDLLNAVGLAAIAILAVRPSELRDASFLLSFLAALTIGGLAVPLLERITEPYIRALDHLGDVTRDAAFAPRAAQLRLDLRAASHWLAARLPARLSRFGQGAVTFPCRVGLRLSELVLLSLAIQMGMLPLMAQYFHRISLVAPAANLPAILLTGLIVPFGFVALLLSILTQTIWPGLTHALGYALSTVIGVLLGIIHWFARPSWVSFRVPSPPLALVIAFFAAALVVSTLLLSRQGLAARAARLGLALSAIVCLLLGAAIAVYPFSPRLSRGRLEITVLDVGQGDSIFVAFPDGHTMLVDGGGLAGSAYVRGLRAAYDVGERVVSPYLWSRGLKRIDVMVLTHGHEDHLGGLPAVLRNFRVGQLWLGRDVNSREFRDLVATARDRSVPVVHITTGEQHDWGPAKLEVLWPPDHSLVKVATNDDSVVLRLTDSRQSLLLTGDIERPVERSLVESGGLVPDQFLKVPHHGGKTSSTEPFLSAVRPKYAAISVGAGNSYGQPNAEVLARLAATGAKIFRTDLDGAITALTDGQSLDVRTFLKPLNTPLAEAAPSNDANADGSAPADGSGGGADAAPID